MYASGSANSTQHIHKSNDDVIDLQKNVARVFQQAVAGGAELASGQAKQWQLNQDLAIDLQHSLEKLREVEIQDLVGAFSVMHDELVREFTSWLPDLGLMLVANVVQAGITTVPATVLARRSKLFNVLVYL